jgi:hypothetical protein
MAAVDAQRRSINDMPLMVGRAAATRAGANLAVKRQSPGHDHHLGSRSLPLSRSAHALADRQPPKRRLHHCSLAFIAVALRWQLQHCPKLGLDVAIRARAEARRRVVTSKERANDTLGMSQLPVGKHGPPSRQQTAMGVWPQAYVLSLLVRQFAVL